MKPSIGRIVLYHGSDGNDMTEHPAIITRVWSDTCVNLSVFFDSWSPSPRTSIVQDEESIQEYGWKWPPRV